MEWILISAISMVSLAILMFLGAHLAIFDEATLFYGVASRSQIVLLSNIFNFSYLAFSPILFSVLKRYYLPIVTTSVICIGIGCTGRYLAGHDYQLALLCTILVGIAHVPIITAPYGIL